MVGKSRHVPLTFWSVEWGEGYQASLAVLLDISLPLWSVNPGMYR
ncbi:MAG: hypothetical protein ANABAC_1490 [Anaerolineae bacterium]|nr:MAG: hypothetical protein ANABAC_1490 [Anaerolineae bacterium]